MKKESKAEKLTFSQWLEHEKRERIILIESEKETIKEYEKSIKELNKSYILKHKQLQYFEKQDFSEGANKHRYKEYLKKLKEVKNTPALSQIILNNKIK